jgi:hypothetical protein
MPLGFSSEVRTVRTPYESKAPRDLIFHYNDSELTIPGRWLAAMVDPSKKALEVAFFGFNDLHSVLDTDNLDHDDDDDEMEHPMLLMKDTAHHEDDESSSEEDGDHHHSVRKRSTMPMEEFYDVVENGNHGGHAKRIRVAHHDAKPFPEADGSHQM